ncbi:alpha/beta hydrolase [Marispirochaeta sp.]|uniref:alpha/beta hydrolase n=1 Tax=Marispirochaeta sp. TaxID=2038653 RepID=UPI0029C7BE6C|nr:alpha/beta hydrolase [Marispirochaeta sp.]
MKTKIFRRTIITLFIIFSIIYVSLVSYTSPFLDGKNKKIENSISELIKVRLGGYKQSILIRGLDRDNPIIIFLHGGPGYPCLSYIKKYQSELEKYFVIVNWDQRGSGKSFSPFIPAGSMTEQQLIIDLDDLVNYVRNRFNKEKIIIVGHSWGTVLGISYSKIHSEKVLAYVGIGQVINHEKAELIGYQFTTNRANETKNEKAIKELESIGKPPYTLASRKMAIQRKWLNRYGGNEITVICKNEIMKSIISSPEYSLFDGLKFFVGNIYSVTKLYKYLEQTDFEKSDKEYSVPIYFCAGKHDYITPSGLTEEHYNQISAPQKELYWFEKSGHEPHLEEKEKFTDVMNRVYALNN